MSLFLQLSCSSTELTLRLSDTSTLPTNGGVLQIESEQVLYQKATDSTVVNCTRGYNSTTPVAHAQHTVVTVVSQSASNGTSNFDLSGNGAPTSTTGINQAFTGCRYTDLSSGIVYVNQGTLSVPNWVMMDAGISGGMTQLTGDVTAGPGSGSQATTLKTVNSNVGSFTSANITVNAKGLITAAANGTAGPTPNVVSHVDTTGADTTSGAGIATTCAVTITASSNTAQIKISVSGTIESASPASAGPLLNLGKDGVDVTGQTFGGNLAWFFNNDPNATVFAGCPASFVWLDTPGDTLPHTYTVYLTSGDGATHVRWLNNGGNGSVGVIIAEEVH